MNSLFKNKSRMKKNGSAFLLIYGLAYLLFAGLLYIVYDQINQNHIRPTLDNPDLNFSQESKDYADKFLTFWTVLLYLILFSVMLFFILWIGAPR